MPNFINTKRKPYENKLSHKSLLNRNRGQKQFGALIFPNFATLPPELTRSAHSKSFGKHGRNANAFFLGAKFEFFMNRPEWYENPHCLMPGFLSGNKWRICVWNLKYLWIVGVKLRPQKAFATTNVVYSSSLRQVTWAQGHLRSPPRIKTEGKSFKNIIKQWPSVYRPTGKLLYQKRRTFQKATKNE